MSGELPVTRVGDTMTHGAVLVFGSTTGTTDNRAVIRLGDTVICPMHGVTTIVSGFSATTTQDGIFVSRLGAKAGCGAMVVSGSHSRTVG